MENIPEIFRNKLIQLDLGKKIKDKRKAERLSADQLANKLKVSAANIYKWEKGTKPSDPEEYRRLKDWLEEIESFPTASSENIPELSMKEIISVLTLALKNESEARREQAETLKIQAGLLDRIEKGMARNDVQAKMSELQDTMDLNLREVRAIVDKLSIGQNKAIHRFLQEFEAIRKGQAHPGATGKRKLGDGKGA